MEILIGQDYAAFGREAGVGDQIAVSERVPQGESRGGLAGDQGAAAEGEQDRDVGCGGAGEHLTRHRLGGGHAVVSQ